MFSRLQKVDWRWFFLSFLFIAVTRVPSLFDPLWYGDEAIYMAVGQGINRGQLLYVDIWDNKPPFLYLVYTMSNFFFGNLLWPLRVLNLILSWVSVYLIYKIGQKVFQFSNSILKITLIFATLLFSFGWEITIFNGENLFLPLVLFGFYGVYNFWNKKFIQLFLPALSFGFAFLIKMNAGFEALALCGLVFVVWLKQNGLKLNLTEKTDLDERKKNDKKFISLINSNQFQIGNLRIDLPKIKFSELQKIFTFTFLIFLPSIVTFLFYFAKNRLPELYFSTLGFSENYVKTSDIPTLFGITLGIPPDFSIVLSGLQWRFILLFATLLITTFLYLKSEISGRFYLLFTWLAVSMFASTISGRNYPHYLLQIIPPLVLFSCWLLGLIFGITESQNQKKPSLNLAQKVHYFASYLIFLNFFTIVFASYSKIPNYVDPRHYYYGFAQVVFGLEPLSRWQRHYNNTSFDVQQNIGKIIMDNTASNQQIFVIGNWPELYVASGRLSAYNQITDYQFNESISEAYAKLRQQAELIVVDKKSPKADKFLEKIKQDGKFQMQQKTMDDRFEIWKSK